MSVSGRFNQLQCISGSTMAGVGQWIAPDGSNITEDGNDVFNITVGASDNPGFTSIKIRDGASLTPDYEGVYTCLIPDENGDMQYLFVGLYGRGFNSKESISFMMFPIISYFSAALPQITSLQLVIESNSALTLNCTSTGSPAMTVVWRKDGAILTNFSYVTHQIMREGLSSTYDNILEIRAEPSELSGTYSCIIHDSLEHNSEPANVEVEGITPT